MPVLNKKTRMISFRLSESEYVCAQRCCPAHGVRSVSTLARNATIGILPRVREPAERQPEAVGVRSDSPTSLAALPTAASTEILLQLQHQVLWLRAELDRITGLIGKPVAPVVAASSLPQ